MDTLTYRTSMSTLTPRHWNEYKGAVEAAADIYNWEFEGDESERENAAMEWLRERTQVIEFHGGVIVQIDELI